MSSTYLIQMVNQTVSAAATLLLIRPPTNRPIRVVRYKLDYGGTATSTQIRYQFGTKASAFPSTLTSVTPIPLDGVGAPAAVTVGGTSGAAGTCGTLATSEGAGTFSTIYEGAFNCLNGLDEFLGDFSELMLPANSSSAFVLRFPAAPGVTSNWTASLWFKEQ